MTRARLFVPRLLRKVRAPRQVTLCVSCLRISLHASMPIQRRWSTEKGGGYVDYIAPGRLAETYFAHPNDRYLHADGSVVRIRGEYLIGGSLYCEPHAMEKLFDMRFQV